MMKIQATIKVKQAKWHTNILIEIKILSKRQQFLDFSSLDKQGWILSLQSRLKLIRYVINIDDKLIDFKYQSKSQLAHNNNQIVDIQFMQAEGENKGSQSVYNEPSNEQKVQNSSRNYKLLLGNQQASYIVKLLPVGYSLQIQPQFMNKSISAVNKVSKGKISKKKSVDSKLLKQVKQSDQININRLPSMRSRRSTNIRYNDDAIDNQQQINQPVFLDAQTQRRNNYQSLDSSLKPCVKILNLLKNNIISWPFRQPVDAIAMGIPQYLEIIKQPMDLSKIESNLRSGQYVTPTQFHADINKIIRNSYLFNKGNLDFEKATQDFQQLYFRIIAEPDMDEKTLKNIMPSSVPSVRQVQSFPVSSVAKRTISKPVLNRPFSNESTISLAQKKQLSLNIRRLPKQFMKGVVDIVRTQGETKAKEEFDIQDLRVDTLRKLQQYVRIKLMETNQKNNQKDNEHRQHQSEFQIQSEQDS